MYAYNSMLAALLLRGKYRAGRAHRRVHAGSPDRMDGLPAVLRVRRGRTTAAHRGGARQPSRLWPVCCGGSGTVMLGVQNEQEWQAFCAQVLRQPALAADALCQWQRNAPRRTQAPLQRFLPLRSVAECCSG